MRETFNSSGRKLVASTKNLLTHPSAEQITKDREATPSSPQSLPTVPGKADHAAQLAEKKRKKRSIPFVALALVWLFMSLGTLSLLQIHPLAMADTSDVPPQTTSTTSDNSPCQYLSNNDNDLTDCYKCVKNGYTERLDACRLIASIIPDVDEKCRDIEGNALKQCLYNLSTDGDYASLPSSCKGDQTTDTDFDNCFIDFLGAGLNGTAVAEAAPPDQSVETLTAGNSGTLGDGYNTDCKTAGYPYRLPQPLAEAGDTFCWNEKDFWWADRDITCLYNDMHGPGAPWQVTLHDKDNNALSISLDDKTQKLNQNTCTSNSICVSDNASRADNSTVLADQIGGDDILCGNRACINEQHGNTRECGDPRGTHKEYDRFACQMTSNSSSQLNDINPNTPPASEPAANYREKRWWWSTGVAINPTAYDPNGALYLPTSNLRAADIEPNADLYQPISATAGGRDTSEPSDHMPECDASGRWSCKNDANIIIYQYNGSITKSQSDSSLYEETTPHYASAQIPLNVGLPGGVLSSAPNAYSPGSAPVPVYWVVCGADGGWAFPCSDQGSWTTMPVITTENNSQSLDTNQVAEGVIVKDWLSGDANPKSDNHQVQPGSKTPQAPTPGHLVYTYLNDTVYQAGIQQLFGVSMGIGFVLIMPVVILIGYQFIWASWTLGRANAMESFGRLILSISAIAISYPLAAMLISLTNVFNTAIVSFHASPIGAYPTVTLGSQGSTFTLANQGETDPASFRGLVIPITRWGCVANDFVSILSNKFWTDAAGNVPFVGGIAKFIGNIANIIDVAHHIGEFMMLILSISLCTQVFMRVILLNYYILTAPMAFGCWGLPGGVGQNVVRSWTKGFCSLLFAQTAQVFILATFPLILPPFPNLPMDRFGLLVVIFQALPRILVLMATLKVPTVMGTGATKAIAKAGTVVSGAVVAAGGMAMNTV